MEKKMDLVKNINMVLIYYLKVNMLMVIGLKEKNMIMIIED